MVVEQEIKLHALNASVLEAVARDGHLLFLARDKSFCQLRVADAYLDTPDLSLSRQRLALRIRQQNDQWWLMLKGYGGVDAGVATREEWQQVTVGPSLRPDDLPDGAIREKLLAMVAPQTPWRVLMNVTMERRVVDLYLQPDTRVELALDVGSVEAGGKSQPFWEVELELKAGFLAPVSRLAGWLEVDYGLVATNHSKFSLGLGLLGIKARDLLGEE